MENISKHISYAEATNSATAQRHGISNVPGATELAAMRRVAGIVFEPLRATVGEPVRVSSFYRNPQVNALVGGSATSQHMKGEAMDIERFDKSNYSNAELFWIIRENFLFDQLIWEFGTEEEPDWVHVSLKTSGNRQQVLQAYKQSGVTKYRSFSLLKKIAEKKKK